MITIRLVTEVSTTVHRYEVWGNFQEGWPGGIITGGGRVKATNLDGLVTAEGTMTIGPSDLVTITWDNPWDSGVIGIFDSWQETVRGANGEWLAPSAFETA